jgi:hypothetical protein
MAELKTKPTKQSVEAFLDTLPDESVRDDCRVLIDLMKKVTGSPPKMWGPSIIGFGYYPYKYASGHEGVMCITGFAPRKQYLSLYVMPELATTKAHLKKLGKHKVSKACLYIKKLKDVDLGILEKIVADSVQFVRTKYPSGT